MRAVCESDASCYYYSLDSQNANVNATSGGAACLHRGAIMLAPSIPGFVFSAIFFLVVVSVGCGVPICRRVYRLPDPYDIDPRDDHDDPLTARVVDTTPKPVIWPASPNPHRSAVLYIHRPCSVLWARSSHVSWRWYRQWHTISYRIG